MYQSDIEKKNKAIFFRRIHEIIFPEAYEIVEKTAFDEILEFSADYSLSGKGRLIIGRVENCEEIRRWDQEGVLNISSISDEDDGFQIKRIKSDIVVAGANPRAVLHGIYALEDCILSGKEEYDMRVVPFFRKRSDAIGHYHSISINLGNDTVDDSKAEYLARLGINQFCACFDCSPFGLHLLDFVKSDVFPFQKDPNPTSIRRLKEMSAVCKKYGIDFIFMLWEPVLPKNYAPLELYPPDALGKVHRPWGGDENNMDTTLCISSPIVQEHYYNIVEKFVREFSDVSGFFFYNLDGSSWLCTPELCQRCKEKIIDSDPDKYNPWETQAELVTVICKAAHSVRKDFTVNFWNPIHFHGLAVKKMYEAAKGYDYVTSGWEGSDHDLYITFPEEPCYEVKETLKAAEKYNAPMYIYFAFNRLEAIQIGFPSPFTVAESLKTFKKWGVSNIMEVTGPTPALNQINAIVMKQFECNPDTDEVSYLQDLAEKQFGKESGQYMYMAWKSAKEAFDSWKHYEACPLSGSQFIVRMSSYYGKVTPEILPSVLDEFENFYLVVLSSVEPWKKESYQKNLTSEFIERFENMEKYISKMKYYMEQAVKHASKKERICICYYQGSFEGLGRPTRKEFALLNLSSVEQAHMICLQVIHMLHAVKLLRIIREETGENVELAKKEYIKLVSEDIKLQKEYVSLLRRLVKRRPCLPLTGICEEELYKYIYATNKKIKHLKAFLLKKKERYGYEDN